MKDRRPVPALSEDRQALVTSLGRLPEQEAEKIARRVGATHLLDDLRSCAKMGATRAAATYSPVEGVTFADFAKHHIRGSVYDCLRQEGRQRTYRRAAEMAAHHGYAQRTPSREDAVDAGRDDEEACRAKLTAYTGAKLSAITVAFWLETEKASLDPETTAAMRPFVDAMRADVAAFRASDQTLLLCVYAEGMTLEEAAHEAGIAHATAKVRHRKLLKLLRECFKKRGIETP